MGSEDRMRAVVLYEEGYSMNKIAERLHVARRTIQELIKKHKETGKVEDRSGRGRKKLTTPRQDRAIIKQSLKDRRKTSKQMARELETDFGIALSSRTVRRRLQQGGLKYCRAKKKPLLTAAARRKRLLWARENKNRNWDKVLFSDESRYCLVSDRPICIRRRKGEEDLPECLNPTMKHGGGGIMVWGCFAKGGVGRLHKVDGTIDGHTTSKY